jgi:hypothetical protein
MQIETQATTGQTDTAPATQQTATEPGTAPAAGSQQQQQQTQPNQAAQAAAADTSQAQNDASNKAPAAAPEQYADFNMPEGYAMQGELGDEFKSVAKELGLTQEQAQKLVDLDVKRANAQAASVHKATAEWLAAAQTDKEFGGDALTENVAIAKKAIDAFGTDALKDLLQQTGLGNHPEMIRAFYRAGKAISEDRFVGGSKSSGQPSTAQRMYPNMNP